MQIKKKIALTLLPIVLISITMINFIFIFFYQKTVKNHELRQIDFAKVNVDTYISEQLNNDLRTAYDWGHWDDTYYFVKTLDSDYISLNLAENTFSDQNLNFAVFSDSDGTVVFKRYFSTAEQKFAEFPPGFTQSVDTFIGAVETSEDITGIFRFGQDYFFVASTYITDSEDKNPPSGRIIFGWLIDDGILDNIEDISGCTFISMNLVDDPETGRTGETVLLNNSYVTDSGNSRIIELLIPHPYDASSAVLVTLSMSRDHFQADIKDMYIFSLFNTIGCLMGSILILLILNSYLTKPITRLIRDVKSIDMNQNELHQLPEEGRDEFSFLRRSISLLLDRIDQGRKSLFDSREELYATLVSVGDGVIVVDNAGKIKFMNPVAQELTGWNAQDAIGQPVEEVFHIINEYTRTAVESPVDQVFHTDRIVALSNHTLLISKDGKERAVEDTAAPIKNTAGITNGCVLVFKDTSEKKERNRRIEYLSYHDQLTGLYNRRFFEHELKRLDIRSNLPLSIIYADVNGLKIINDAFGHESGDKIIQQVSEILTSFTRPNDIVARVGGDEFVALLPRTDETETEKIVELLKEKTNELYYMDIELSISFGWDTKLEERQSARDVMRNAEDIMYQKKMLSSTSKRNSIIKSILNALHFKCPREEAHSVRVSNLCETIGKACGMETEELKELVVAGELHDIGKIAIDESILNKTEPLTKAEWSQIKHHPEVGFRLLGATNEFSNIAEYVLSHHEKWDGTGYPKGLMGTEIDIKARIISIADSYDAMTCDRPYRKAMDPAAAAEEIRRCAGTHYDPDIARVFIEKVLMLEW